MTRPINPRFIPPTITSQSRPDPKRPLHGYSGHIWRIEGTPQPLHVRIRPALALASRVVTGAAIGAWLALFAWHGFSWVGRVM